MAKKIDIGGELHSVATDHKVADASEIKDISKGNKSQAAFNNDVDRHEVDIHGTGGINDRLDDLEAMEQIVIDGGEAQIAQGSDFTNPDATKRAKIPTVGAIVDGLNDGIYDVSKRNPTAGPNSDGKFTLDYILDNANTLIPIGWRHGGMIISFVQSSDNKYVQFRYMGTIIGGNHDPFLDTNNWQGVDIEVTPESMNLASNKAVVKYVGTDKTKEYVITAGSSIPSSIKVPVNIKAGERYSVEFDLSNGADINNYTLYDYSSGEAVVISGGLLKNKKYIFEASSDISSLYIYCFSENVIASGNGTLKIKSGLFEETTELLLNTIKGWILGETFTLRGTATYNDGVVASPVSITWPDGTEGTLTITRDDTAMVTRLDATYGSFTYRLNITRDIEGNIISETFNLL